MHKTIRAAKAAIGATSIEIIEDGEYNEESGRYAINMCGFLNHRYKNVSIYGHIDADGGLECVTADANFWDYITADEVEQVKEEVRKAEAKLEAVADKYNFHTY